MKIGSPSTNIVMRLEAHGSELSLEAAAALRAQYKRATDAEYFKVAYRNMLGPKGLKVAALWEKGNVQRVHFDWGPDAGEMTGEERAETILSIAVAPSRKVTDAELAKL